MRALSAVFAGLLAVTAACRGEKRSREEDPTGKPAASVLGTTPAASPRFEVDIASPGLDPANVETHIARPVEQALAGIDGVREIRSSSRSGMFTARCILAPGRDAGETARAAVAALGPLLPESAGAPVVRMAPDARRFTVVLSAPALDRATASDFVERHIRPALERVRGVRQVTACGSAPAIVTIEIDPDRLGAHGATLADIEPAVAGARTIEEIDAAPLPGARGAAVRDIARVGRAAELAACRAMTAAGPVVSIEVVASAEAAPGPALTDAVSALASTLPAGAELRVLAPGRDQTWVEIWFDVPVGADDLARGVIERLGDVSSAVALVVEQRDPSAVDGDHPALRALAVSGDRAGLLAAAAKLPFRARVPADEARFRIRGDDGDALRTAAERAVGQLSGGSDAIAAAGIAEPEPSTVPSVELEIDRDRATQLGVTAGDIARVVELAAGPGGKPIGRIADGTPVHLRLAGAAVAGGRTPAPEQLSRLTVRARDGAVPISSVVKIELGQEPLSILRIDRQRAIELWVAPRPGATTEAALAAAKARLASFELPQGTTLDWGD